jgi:retron-type reverse transcriptase
LKCDIRKFFANINHEILKQILGKHIKDKDIILLPSEVIDSFSSNPIDLACGIKGLPLGNLTSQLLVNIYMNEFDQFMKRELKVKYYIRYADDFVILNEDKKYLEELLLRISNFLKNKLRLQLHPDKVSIKTMVSGVDFLGWVNFPKHRVLRTSTKRRMFKRLKENPKEESRQSYLGVLSHGNTKKLVNEIQRL